MSLLCRLKNPYYLAELEKPTIFVLENENQAYIVFFLAKRR